MGWWTLTIQNQEFLLGDAPLDLISEAFEQVALEYAEKSGRKPTLDELLFAVKVVLQADLQNYVSSSDSLHLVDLSAKTKKRPKLQFYGVGDVFAIPLQKGYYAFGRILSDILKAKMGMLVGVYDLRAKYFPSVLELSRKQFMFTPFYCSDQGWVTWRWKIFDNLPIAKNEFQYPRFKQGTESTGWTIVDQNKVYEATSEEVNELEYAKLWTMKSVERRIEEYFTTQAMHNTV
jgi:hypothetical protein